MAGQRTKIYNSGGGYVLYCTVRARFAVRVLYRYVRAHVRDQQNSLVPNTGFFLPTCRPNTSLWQRTYRTHMYVHVHV